MCRRGRSRSRCYRRALDRADPDAEHIVALLDAIPGAYERTQEGIAQARRGEGIPLDRLA